MQEGGQESATDREPAKRKRPRKQADKQASDRQDTSTELRAHATGDVQDMQSAPPESSVMLPDDKREQVWSLHLRGVSRRQIARQCDIHRDTVGRLINDCYREFGSERQARLKRKLNAAVARIEAIGRQAWADHDTDDMREQAFIQAAVPGTKYQSQRSQYLRIALDAEKEIARLEGLYADDVQDVTGVLFRIERVERVERIERVERVEVVKHDDGH